MNGTVSAIVEAVRFGTSTAEAVMNGTIAAIARYDRVQPQAWISRLPDEVLLETARAVDRRIAAGEPLALAGVPFAVKDNIDVAGLPTTAASPAYAYDPPGSARVVEHLLAAGAICIGKTNLDQFATGLVGTRTPYGLTHCVFNRDFVSGGSSSGSAVVVAAGLVPFALGTDTAGSGRVPAAINGCVGFKPTRGRWSSRGMLPACRTLDCVSVFTREVADAAIIDMVVRGFDTEDPFSRIEPTPAPIPQTVTIGVPSADAIEFFSDAESSALFRQATARLKAAGATLRCIDLAPLINAGNLLYDGPWVAERSAAVGQFIAEHPDAVHPVVAAIIKNGMRHTAVDTFHGIYALQAFARDMANIWAEVDAVMLPTTPTVYPIAKVLEEPFALNARMGIYTAGTNLLDLCAIALPAGHRVNGTGFGVSLLGPAFADPLLLGLGERYMSVDPAPAPPLDMTVPNSVELAVVGAHLEGMPLHGELTSRGARLVARTGTATSYRLYAMANSVPPKPALVHVGEGGFSIAVEVYSLPFEAFGHFVASIPPPLAIGTLKLADGSSVKGFVAEPRAITDAEDISAFGGWSAYLNARAAMSGSP